VKSLKVEELADGKLPPEQDILQFAAALQRPDAPGNCCKRK
jgi:hypothetical protein